MRLFITGASGYVGRRLLARLDPAKFEGVFCLSRKPAASEARPGVEWLRGSLAEIAQHERQLGQCGAVLHLAATTGKAPPKEYWQSIAEGTRALVEACRRSGAARVVNVSTIAVRFPDKRRYPYAQAKEQAEEIVRQSGLRFTTVRPTIVVGPDAPVLAGLARLAAAPVMPVFGNGRARVQPVFVDDLVDFLLALVESDRFAGEALDFGGPEAASIEDFLKKIRIVCFGKKPGAVHLPMPLLVAALTALETVAYPLLPITVGQLATFRFDGTAEPNAAWEARRGSLRGIDQMLRLSCGDARA